MSDSVTRVLTEEDKIKWKSIDKNSVDIIVSYIDCKEAIEKEFPSVKGKRKEIQKALMIMVSNPLYVKEDNGYILPRKIYKHWGIHHETLKKILKEFPLYKKREVEGDSYNRFKRKAIVYDITDHYKNILKDMSMNWRDFHSRVVLSLIDEKKEDVSTKSLSNYNISSDYKINDSEMDIDKVLNIMPSLSEENKYLSYMLINNYRKMPCDIYTYYDCGRYFISNGVSLQNVKRVIRSAALDGSYIYDFTNCHYVILNHIYKHKAIQNYVDNREYILQEMVENCGIKRDIAKMVFLSVLYGASSKFRQDHPWEKEMDENTFNKVVENPHLKALFSIRPVINEYMKKQYNIKSSRSHCAICDVTMQYENEMLMVLADFSNPQVLLFDGLVSKTPVNKCKVEKEILNRLGIEIKITEELIKGGTV